MWCGHEQARQGTGVRLGMPAAPSPGPSVLPTLQQEEVPKEKGLHTAIFSRFFVLVVKYVCHKIDHFNHLKIYSHNFDGQ